MAVLANVKVHGNLTDHDIANCSVSIARPNGDSRSYQVASSSWNNTAVGKEDGSLVVSSIARCPPQVTYSACAADSAYADASDC